jgi:predicted nucleic acid-binding Zn ribbon protein
MNQEQPMYPKTQFCFFCGKEISEDKVFLSTYLCECENPLSVEQYKAREQLALDAIERAYEKNRWI